MHQRFAVTDLLPAAAQEEQVLRLHAERVQVDRRLLDTGTVKIAVVTRARDQVVDETLCTVTAAIEHVPVGRIVDEMPPVRQEGDTTIIPVVEEIVVTRLFLREEVRITRVTSTRRHQETVVLRTEEAVVTRSGQDTTSSEPNFAQHPAIIGSTDHGQ